MNPPPGAPGGIHEENTLKNLILAAGLGVLFAARAAIADVGPGDPAPDFSLRDVNGKQIRLSEFRGRHVVVEWFNAGCPFVQKHYETGNMQAVQKRYTDQGVVWLAINSTHPKSADYRDTARSQALLRDWKMAPTALALDEDGRVGQSFGAKATPHMFVLDPKGRVVYAGAIDDKATWKHEDVKTARNLVAAALDESLAGKPVSTASTAPYGCSVKY
jgi:peroxiredoxin